MLVRVNNVVVTNTNADGGAGNFGEFLIQTSGAAATAVIRVNDFSLAISKTPLYNTTLAVGTRFTFIQGLWDYSFNNFKLEPEVPSDLARATAVAGEDRASGLALLAPSPEPGPWRGDVHVPHGHGRRGHDRPLRPHRAPRRDARRGCRPAGRAHGDVRDAGPRLGCLRRAPDAGRLVRHALARGGQVKAAAGTLPARPTRWPDALRRACSGGGRGHLPRSQ